MSATSKSAARNRDHTPEQLQRLLSPADVASYLGVRLRTVYRWRSRREGPRGYRIGRHVRFMLDDVAVGCRITATRPDEAVGASTGVPSPARATLYDSHSGSEHMLVAALLDSSERSCPWPASGADQMGSGALGTAIRADASMPGISLVESTQSDGWTAFGATLRAALASIPVLVA